MRNVNEEEGLYLNRRVVEFLQERFEDVWDLLQDLITLTEDKKF